MSDVTFKSRPSKEEIIIIGVAPGSLYLAPVRGLGTFRGPPGEVLEPSGGHFGPLGPSFGALWGHLGPLWALLGAILGQFGLQIR